MWAEVNGERKKVACGPCIRGHRSSKCDHRDRVLVEVRKPGRPLSSCPHPSGSCSCERIVINYTIPKSSECACPSERAQPVATVAGNSRIQKNRRKSTVVNASALEKAIRAGQDTETDASSYTGASTERSGSNEASPPSSASSTPRISPKQSESTSSCCQPKPIQQPVPQAGGGCCGSKAKQNPEPVQVKSCCSGSKSSSAPTPQPHTAQHHGQQIQFQLQPQSHPTQFPHMQHQATVPNSFPFGLGAPIYNHAAAAYQRPTAGTMSPSLHSSLSSQVSGSQGAQHSPEHNCHCGDSCSCFGCAAHPNNATMMEYVRLMAQFQYTGGFGTMPPPLYDMPTYPHHPGYGAEAHAHLGLHSVPPHHYTASVSTPGPGGMQQPSPMNLSNLMQPPLAVSTSWQPPHVPTPSMPEPQFYEPTSYIVSTPMSEIPPTLKMEEQVHTPTADNASDGKDEDTPTLSPSSYFWNQMELPGCSDATGTCQCGDGCECVGCLTHGGHNGVQLEAPPLDDSHSFSGFANNPELQMHNIADFLFNPTHT